MLKDIRGGEFHDRRPTGFDWQGHRRSGVRKESDTLESWVVQRVRLVFGSIAVETAAPEAVSSHPSSIGVVGSELRVGADAGAASGVLFGGRARSYPS